MKINAGSYSQLTALGTWVQVYLTLQNIGRQNFGINSHDFQLQTDAGTTYNVTSQLGMSTWLRNNNLQTLGGQIPPGASFNTGLLFDVNPQEGGLTLKLVQANTSIDLGSLPAASASATNNLQGSGNAPAPAPPLPPTPAPAPASDPVSTVTQFYYATAAQNFQTAWRLLSPRFQSTQSYDAWKSGYSQTRSAVVSGARIVNQSPGRATVSFTLVSVDDQNGTRVTRTFQGTWQLVQTGGKWLLDTPSIRQVG